MAKKTSFQKVILNFMGGRLSGWTREFVDAQRQQLLHGDG
jgi:hypothetical protein